METTGTPMEIIEDSFEDTFLSDIHNNKHYESYGAVDAGVSQLHKGHAVVGQNQLEEDKTTGDALTVDRETSTQRNDIVNLLLDSIQELHRKLHQQQTQLTEIHHWISTCIKNVTPNSQGSKDQPENITNGEQSSEGPVLHTNRPVGKIIKSKRVTEKEINDAIAKLKDIDTVYVSDVEPPSETPPSNPQGSFVRTASGYKQTTKDKSKSSVTGSADPREDSHGMNVTGSHYKRRNDHEGSSSKTCKKSKKLHFETTKSECKGKSSKVSQKMPVPEGGGPTRAYKFVAGKTVKRGRGTVILGGRPYDSLLPSGMNCAFVLKPSMKLTNTDLHVCAYVFNEDLPLSEELFKCGEAIGTRGCFDCMVPGKVVLPEIFHMMTVKVAWTQQNSVSKTVWCLPPSFAADVARGCSCEQLIEAYKDEWLGQYERLRLIYVPVEDAFAHWYLMVISLEDRKIWHMDCNLTIDVIEERHFTIKKISAAFARIVKVVFEGNPSMTYLSDYEDWGIHEPRRGIPNCGNSDTAGLWVAEWLNMQNNFTTNPVGLWIEDNIRMRVVLRLLVGNHNVLKSLVIKKAQQGWLKYTT